MNDQAEATSSTDSPAPGRPKRRLWRWPVRLLLVLALGLGVLVVFAPGILSGSWGKARLLDAVNARLNGTASIESLDLSWRGTQQVKGLTVRDANGQTVVHADSVSLDASLLSLAIGERDLGEIAIDGPRLNVVVDANDRTNLEKLLPPRPDRPADDHVPGAPDGAADGPFELPFTFVLTVNNAKFTATGPSFEPVTIDLGMLKVDAAKFGQPIVVHAAGSASQADLAGTIAIDGFEIRGLDPRGRLVEQQLALAGKAELTDLPVAGIDALAQAEGRLLKYIGPRLGLTLNAAPVEGRAGVHRINILTHAEQAQADLTVDFSAKALVIRPGFVKASPPNAAPVTFDVQSGRVNLAALGDDKPAAFEFRAKARQNGLQGSIAADGTVDPATGRVRGTAQVIDLPVEGVDALLRQDGLLTTALGAYVSAGVEIKPGRASGDFDIDLRAMGMNERAGDRAAVQQRFDEYRDDPARPGTPLFVHASATLAEQVLRGSGNARFRAAPELLGMLAGRAEGFDGRLADPVDVMLELESFQAPTTGFDPTRLALHGKLAVGDGSLTGDPRLGDIGWSDLSGSVRTDHLAQKVALTLDGQLVHADGARGPLQADVTVTDLLDSAGKPRYASMQLAGTVELGGIPASLVERFAKTGGAVRLALGPRIDLTLQAPNAGADAVGAHATVRGAHGRADLAVTIDDRIRLAQPATVTLDRPGPLLEHFGRGLAGYRVTIGKPLALQIETFDMPRPADLHGLVQPARTTLIAQLTTGDVRVTDPPNADPPLGPVHLSSVTIDITHQALDQPRVEAHAVVAADPGGTVARYLSQNFTADLTASTTLSGALKTGPIGFTAELANHVDTVQPLHSATLTGEVAADFSRIKLTRPGEVRYVLMPQVLPAGQDRPKLAGPAELALTLKRLQAPIADFDLRKVKAHLTAQVKQASLTGDPRLASASLKDLALEAAFDGPANALSYNAEAQTAFAAEGSSVAGSLSADGRIGRLLDADGNANRYDRMAIEAAVHLHELPLAWVDAVAPGPYTATAIAGHTLNVELGADLDRGDGTLDLVAHAPRAQADVHAAIADGMLTLRRDANASFSVSEQLSRQVINHPLLKQAVRSEDPVTVDAEADGFQLPLGALLSDDPKTRAQAMSKAQIKRLTIDP
ncbi:MAG: hypothetical protein GVY28_08735, partial [Alphaproteobacteria bacterium]|nr:hypothetical protein [Alphaproteobacteria bacterium]